jgi:hypothetical protein
MDSGSGSALVRVHSIVNSVHLYAYSGVVGLLVFVRIILVQSDKAARAQRDIDVEVIDVDE